MLDDAKPVLSAVSRLSCVTRIYRKLSTQMAVGSASSLQPRNAFYILFLSLSFSSSKIQTDPAEEPRDTAIDRPALQGCELLGARPGANHTDDTATRRHSNFAAVASQNHSHFAHAKVNERHSFGRCLRSTSASAACINRQTHSNTVNINSGLVIRRLHDVSRSGFNKWPFMSVHTWGESPHGVWQLEIHNEGRFMGT